MSYTLYNLNILISVLDYKKWEKSINQVKETTRNNDDQLEVFILNNIQKGMEESFKNSSTVMFMNLFEDEGEAFLQDYFGSWPSLTLSNLLDKLINKTLKKNTIILAGVEIVNSTAGSSTVAYYALDQGDRGINNISKRQDWSTIQKSFASCGIRLTKGRKEYLKKFPDKEFDFVRKD